MPDLKSLKTGGRETRQAKGGGGLTAWLPLFGPYSSWDLDGRNDIQVGFRRVRSIIIFDLDVP